MANPDIDGAFDTVPRDKLAETLWRSGAEERAVRFLEKWLKNRRFRVRLNSASGKQVSTPRKITQGLPQGGIISPFLWIMHFNECLELIGLLAGGAGGLEPGLGGSCVCLVYADDVVFAIAHAKADFLVKLAEIGDSKVRSALACLHLQLARPKCNNLVLAPGEIVGAAQGRCSQFSDTVRKELPERGRRLGELLESTLEDVFPLHL